MFTGGRRAILLKSHLAQYPSLPKTGKSMEEQSKEDALAISKERKAKVATTIF